MHPQDENSVTGASDKKKKKEAKVVWFDWDKAASSFKRAEENAIKTLKETVETTLASMESMMSIVSNEKNKVFKPLMATEFDLCQKRADFLKLVVSCQDNHVEDLKAAIVSLQSPKDNMSSKGSAKGSARGKSGTIGKSPPCLSFASMVTLKSLADLTEKYMTCENKVEMLQLQKANREARNSVAKQENRSSRDD